MEGNNIISEQQHSFLNFNISECNSGDTFYIPNLGISIHIEGIDDEKRFIFKNISQELGTYFVKLEFFKCTALKLNSLLFDLQYIGNHPIINYVFNNTKHINCEFNNIKEFTKLPSNLETLICGYNKIKILDALPSTIKNITASNNQLEYVNVENCQVTNLDFSYNKLSLYSNLRIPNHVESLNLSHNLFTYVHFIEQSINKLQMEFNMIHIIYALPNGLMWLSLRGNFIVKFNLPDRLNNQLQYLNLNNNNLSQFRGIYNVLTDLWICNNNLEHIDATFKQLEKLYCSFNKIKYLNIPDTVSTLHCVGTRLINIRITDNMTNVYLSLETLQNITPFDKFIKLYKSGCINKNDANNNDIYISNIAARIIQNTFRRNHNKYDGKWDNIKTVADLKESGIVIII